MTNIFLGARQEVCIDWLAFTTKFENSGNGPRVPWDDKRETIIASFEQQFDMVGMHKDVINKNTTNGYNHIVTYTNGVELKYHDLCDYMGVNIQMSGSALRTIRQSGKTDYDLIMQMVGLRVDINGVIWEASPTRIDLAIDYFNSKLVIDDLVRLFMFDNKSAAIVYNKLNKKTQTYSDAKTMSDIRVVNNGDVFNTFYLGSSKGSFQFRGYNKHFEQISQGKKVDFDSWVRFELSIFSDLSESFVNSVLNLRSANDFGKLFYLFVLRKFKIRYFDDFENGLILSSAEANYHDLTLNMIEFASGAEIVEFSKQEPDDFILSSYNYLLSGAGLVSHLKMYQKLDPEAPDKFFKELRKLLNEYEFNDQQKAKMKKMKAQFYTDGYVAPWNRLSEECLAEHPAY